MPTTVSRIRSTAPRLIERLRARINSDDGGFILLESLIAISLITVIMAAIGVEYVSSMATANNARFKSVAAQTAVATMEQIKGQIPTAKVAGTDPSTLLTNRGQTEVETEYTALAAKPNVAPYLRPAGLAAGDAWNAAADHGQYAAYDSTDQGTPTVPTTATTATNVGSAVFTVWRFLQCAKPSDSGSCVSTATTQNNLQVVVAVTWRQKVCPNSECAFVLSSIVNDDPDPTFDLKQPAPALPVPQLTSGFATTKSSSCNPGGTTYQVPVYLADVVSIPLGVTTSGGVPPFLWTYDKLPQGLDVTGQTLSGTVGGNATASGKPMCTTLTVRDAFDSASTPRSGVTYLEWTIAPALTFSVAPQSGIVGQAANLALSVGNGSGDYTFDDTATNPLPPGLSISNSLVTGTYVRPSPVPNAYPVVLTAVDNDTCLACVDQQHASVAAPRFSWTVGYGPLVIANPGTQTATKNTALNAAKRVTMTGSGGDGTYNWSATGLPSGLTINASTGAITGTPTAATTPTSSTVTVTLSDASAGVSSVSTTFTWTVVAAPTVGTPTNQTNSNGGSASVAMTGISCPNAPCSYSLSGQPNGLTINSSTGTISGTVATTTSASAVKVTITDSAGAPYVTGSFSWTILGAPTVSAVTPNKVTETATDSTAVTYNCPIASCTIRLAGSVPGLGLTTVAATGNQTGTSLTVTKASGTVYISGTIQTTAVTGTDTTKAYTPTITITTSDNSGANAGALNWTAFVPPTLTAPGDLISSQYASVRVALAGSCPNTSCSYAMTGAPAGLSIDAATGIVSGTVTSAPNATAFTATVTVTDNDGVAATINVKWTITGTSNNLATLFNNVGVTADNNTAPGNFDGNGNSFSAGRLASATPTALTAGSSVVAGGLQFTWPSTAGTGQADNLLANGTTVTMSGSGKTLGFLVSSANNATSGTGTVTYTDNSTSSYTLAAQDWVGGNTTNAIATTAYRNIAGNKQASAATKIYYVGVAVTEGKQVKSVSLPNITNNPKAASLHVFAMSLTSASVAASNNNVGVTADNATATGNFDATGNSFSATALSNKSVTAGNSVTSSGTTFTWPATANSASADNTVASGQLVDFTGSGSALGFLVSAQVAATGSGTVYYTDGTQQTFTISSPALGATSPTPAIATTYMNAQGNKQVTTAANVFYASAPLADGKTINYVQLPVSNIDPAKGVHVFAMAVKP